MRKQLYFHIILNKADNGKSKTNLQYKKKYSDIQCSAYSNYCFLSQEYRFATSVHVNFEMKGIQAAFQFYRRQEMNLVLGV